MPSTKSRRYWLWRVNGAPSPYQPQDRSRAASLQFVSRIRCVITAGSSPRSNVTVRSNPCGRVINTRTPLRRGSAAIQASQGWVGCRPATSIRSRRVQNIPSRSRNGQGHLKTVVVVTHFWFPETPMRSMSVYAGFANTLCRFS